jgi:NADH dehydrogenase
LKDDFRSIRPQEAQIILMDGAPSVLMPFPEDLSQKAVRSLAKLGVQIKTGVMVKDIDRDGVTYEVNGVSGRLDARTVIWAGGVAVPVLAKTLAKRANVAMQQGAYAAKTITRKLQGGKELPPFAYFDRGNLAGRAAAVANVFGVHLSGMPAWLVWAFMHLMYIVEFQSRILVFIQWTFQDLTFSRAVRPITGTSTTDFNFNKEVASQRISSLSSAEQVTSKAF